MNETGQSSFNQARIEWAIRLQYSPMPNLDMGWVASQLNAFRIGELRTVGKIWEIMLERDGELAVNADKRAADLAALEWNVVSDGSADGDKHAQALTYFYQHLRATHALNQDRIGGVSELLYQMASAHSHYYSAHEMLLRVDNPAANEVTAEFRHTPVWFFEARRGYLAYLKHIFDVYGQPCMEGEWLTCVGSGWMRPLSIAYTFKQFAMRDWAIFCTRYGSGFLEGITTAQKGDAAWEEAKQMLRDMANDGVALHNEGVTMKFLDNPAKANLPFPQIIELANGLYSKCYRGVELATGSRSAPSGGGSSGSANPVGASVMSEESGIFLARDAAWSTGYLNERVDRPIIRYLFDQEPRAYATVLPPLEDTTEEDLNAVKTLVPMGWRISLKEAYKRFRWKAPGDGEPCLQAAAPISPAGPTTPTVAAAAPAPAPEAVEIPAAPKTADEAQASTQPAQPEKPIGAGADPASLGKSQSFAPEMPDPQVDAAGFWSKAGDAFTSAGAAIKRAIFGPFTRNADGTLPTAAYSIANDQPPKVSDDFVAAARKQYAAGVHDDMSYAAHQVKSLLQIMEDDPDHAAHNARKLLARWDSVTGNTLLAPAAAVALEPIVSTAFLNGLQRPETSLANWDPDQPRDNLGRWADENGGGLSEKDNLQRGQKAMDRAIRQKTDVQKAMHRKEAGQIDFKWGTPGETKNNFAGGHGISHILAKHGEADARAMPEVLAKGRITPHPEGDDKRLVEHGNYVASLARNNSRSAFVLTGFKRKLG
jgi:phage gp29-like protein